VDDAQLRAAVRGPEQAEVRELERRGGGDEGSGRSVDVPGERGRGGEDDDAD